MDKILNKTNLSRLAVLIIDMQDYYLNGDRVKTALIPNQIEVLKFCKEHNILVIVIEYCNRGQTTKKLWGELKHLPENNLRVLIKESDSAFRTTDLDSILKARKIKYLLIAGVNACACVLATAECAIERGYKIITSENLIAGCCEECSMSDTHGWYAKNGVYRKNHQDIIQHLY